MTKRQFLDRVTRVKGLKVTDPWGDVALVDFLGEGGESVWLRYEGLEVPFERGVDALVDAANGIILADKAEQFAKHLVAEDGMAVTLYFEPFWSPPVHEARRSPAPRLVDLKPVPRRSKRRF